MYVNIVSTTVGLSVGYIAYGVHLCNKILIFQGTPKNGPTLEMWINLSFASAG